MKFNFFKNHLIVLLNSNPDSTLWHANMKSILPRYGIDTPDRVAGFIAQCSHESADFRILEENLNYSEKALNSVFSRYFGNPPKRRAADYARNPKMIANYVYQDEFRSAAGALGNTNPGDGWKFRGRGLKQLTGRSNYTAFGKTVNMTAEDAADYVSSRAGALESACWFWKAANCNRFADSGDIVGMSRAINGGTIGLADRQNRWNRAVALFDGRVQDVISTVRLGSRGNDVKIVQLMLQIYPDGVYGPGTDNAVKRWQRSNNLVPDGIIGPKTLKKLLKG